MLYYTNILNLISFTFCCVYFVVFILSTPLPGDQPGADVGPLISPQAKDRVNSLIQSGVDEGAKVLLDGRNVKVKGYENGNFVGPTIVSNVTVRVTIHASLTQMKCSILCPVCYCFLLISA